MESPRTPALAPCPFCGGEAVIDSVGGPNTPFQAECTKCVATGHRAPYEKKAAEFWNRRAPVAPLAPSDLQTFDKWWEKGGWNSAATRRGVAEAAWMAAPIVPRWEHLDAAPKGDMPGKAAGEAATGREEDEVSIHPTYPVKPFNFQFPAKPRAEDEGNALDGSAKRVTEPQAAQEGKYWTSPIERREGDQYSLWVYWDGLNVGRFLGYREAAERIKAALEGAKRPGEPLGEPEQSPRVTPKLPIEGTGNG